MPKREDEGYCNEKINICPHGHYLPVCDICKTITFDEARKRIKRFQAIWRNLDNVK